LHRLIVGEELHEIDEVIYLADDSAAVLLRIMHPTLARNRAGVDSIRHRERHIAWKLASQLDRQRRKAPIESHRDRHAAVEMRLHDAIEPWGIDREWLLDQNCLACP